MFNLLKKTKTAVQKLTETHVSVARTIEKVHYEFDSAAERLLNEAKSIISKEDTVKTSKAERLKKLGFSISKAVVETEQQIKDAAESKRVAEAILYYQQWYPMNKFITEKEVKAICEKYGLLFGESKYYKGDIPEKNLTEIEAFKLREDDMEAEYDYTSTGYLSSLWAQSAVLGGLRGMDFIGQSRRSDAQMEYEYQRRMLMQSFEPTKDDNKTKKKRQPAFKICAPEKDFDTRYMKVVDGYKLQYDPIVLQPVKDGYLIVSKWGLEANDEIAINPIQN